MDANTSSLKPTNPPSDPSTSESGLDSKMRTVSKSRKYILVFLFAVAQFVDICNVSSLLSAVPQIAADLKMTTIESIWLISAYQLSFASFLLLGGRMSDLYDPKNLFIGGFFAVAVFSLAAGFNNSAIGLIILRAITGFFASMTIPSALNLIIHMFPDPDEQAHAISMFAGSGPIGLILGLFIGALFVQHVSWRWIYFFSAIVAFPVSCACILIIPSNIKNSPKAPLKRIVKLKKLDIIGVSTITIAVILFIFAVTSGPSKGWASAYVLAPLIISIVMIIGFLFYEKAIPAERAALPPQVWFFPNFSVWFSLSLLPYTWFTAIFFQLTTYWQDVVGWSALTTVVHFLPFGVTAFITIFFLRGLISKWLGDRLLVVVSCILLALGPILLAFCDTASRYWSFAFPAFVLGSVGNNLVYGQMSVAVFKTAPPSKAGVVGAILNSALQLGSAIGSAVTTAIVTNVNNQQPNPNTTFKGRAAGFWFLVALTGVELIGFLIFYRDVPPPKEESESDETESPSAQLETEKTNNSSSTAVDKDQSTVQ